MLLGVLASFSLVKIHSSLASASNAATYLMMIHKFCISLLNLVCVFALVMDLNMKCPPSDLCALGYDKYTISSVS